MNKQDLINDLAETFDLPKGKAASIVDGVLGSIVGALSRGEDARFVGFGTFSRNVSEAREGRNPRTGEPITIPKQTRPKFSPGRPFKDALNV